MLRHRMRPRSILPALAVAFSPLPALAQSPRPAPAPPPANIQPQPQPQSYQPAPLTPGYGPAPGSGVRVGTDESGAAPPASSVSLAPLSETTPPPVLGRAPTMPSEPPPLADPHAPRYALWVGGRVSFVGFAFGFYENQTNKAETTGNFIGTGVAPQIDVGARIQHRYMPYVFWEHGFMGQGRRFEGTDVHGTTDFYGVGFRYLAGNVDSVAFLTDLSIGSRRVTAAGRNQSYTMSGLEFFRLGLGAEVRVTTLLAISPLVSISSGALSGTDGNVAFACSPNCPDGINGPTYANGADIDKARAYLVLSAGLGIHFDVFGK